MRFDCGPTWAEQHRRLEDWHPFFTILPRRVGSHDCRVFEWIERRGTFDTHWGWDWEYRAKEQP
jgi:hypothetical protein